MTKVLCSQQAFNGRAYLATVCGLILFFLTATSVQANQYAIFVSKCSSPGWTKSGVQPSQPAQRQNLNYMRNLAAQWNRENAPYYKYEVGVTSNDDTRIIQKPTSSPNCSGSGNGNGNGNGNGGGNGNGNGNGNGGCYGTIDNPFFVIARQVNGRWEVYGNAYFCSRSARDNYLRTYSAWFQRNRYGAYGGSVRWNSCGPQYFRCQNGFVTTVSSYSQSSSWPTN